MQHSFSDWSVFFSDHGLHEIIPYVGKFFAGSSFNELAAMRERMLEITFHEHDTPNDERATAASWANILESLIVLLLADRPDMHLRFIEARNASMDRASQYGYGSIGYAALHEPGEVATRIFGDAAESLGRQPVVDRRAFLMSVAFGRSEDAPSSGG